MATTTRLYLGSVLPLSASVTIGVTGSPFTLESTVTYTEMIYTVKYGRSG